MFVNLFFTHLFQRGVMLFFTIILKIRDPETVKDYRPISLIGCQYKIFGKLLANRLVEVIQSVVSLEQSTFIKGKEILDGPFLLNKMVAWSKDCRNPMVLFKVDFKKPYDSLSLDYLLEIMLNMGFGSTWCRRIKELLTTTRASVLVNVSLPDELQIHRGLRQGDLFSPYLSFWIWKVYMLF